MSGVNHAGNVGIVCIPGRRSVPMPRHREAIYESSCSWHCHVLCHTLVPSYTTHYICPTPHSKLIVTSLVSQKERVFTVIIPHEENVSALKEVIKTVRGVTFQGINAREIALYKYLGPFCALTELPSMDLNPLDIIGEVFEGDLNRNYIHIVVQPPAGRDAFSNYGYLLTVLSLLKLPLVSETRILFSNSRCPYLPISLDDSQSLKLYLEGFKSDLLKQLASEREGAKPVIQISRITKSHFEICLVWGGRLNNLM